MCKSKGDVFQIIFPILINNFIFTPIGGYALLFYITPLYLCTRR